MRFPRSARARVVGFLALTIALLIGVGGQGVQAQAIDGAGFRSEFNFDHCTFVPQGSNQYFILEPGYRLVLRGTADGERVDLTITVLDQTKRIGNVDTRVVEERESADGELVEISRNYFAICQQTNDMVYFGEDVDIYENGKIASHDGAWLAYANDARPGLIMPGTIVLGDRYFQEIAPGVALDRAENISTSEVVQTPAGPFTQVLKTKETTPLEPGEGFKFYAPGIGLIQDGELKLVSAGQSPAGGNDGGNDSSGDNNSDDNDSSGDNESGDNESEDNDGGNNARRGNDDNDEDNDEDEDEDDND